MTRNMSRVLVLLLLALVGMGLSPSGYALAIASHSGSLTIITSQTTGDPGFKIFTVMVSSQGFNGSSNTLNLDVSQGDQVEITFVYDSPVNTAHQMRVEGYNIQTAIIDKANPTSKIQFIAGQAGSFLIHCIIPCVGMENLQNAWLVVKPLTGVIIGTMLTLRTTLRISTPTGSVLDMIARVSDSAGNPITGLIVSFYISTDFGMINIGENVTDTNGMARFTYSLTSIREMTVEADFPGSGIYQSGNATALLTPSNSSKVLVPVVGENNPPGGEGNFFDIRLVGVSPEVNAVLATIVLVVILCVWSTYAYVIGLILKIKKQNSKKS